MPTCGIKKNSIWDTWLAQLEEHATLDLGVVSSSPTLSVEITKKISVKKNSVWGLFILF